MSSPPGPGGLSVPMERRVLWTLAGVQFLVIVDHTMVLPLGPDLSEGVGLPVADLGLLVGAYTLAAALSSLLLASHLDRVPRRRALSACLLGLGLAGVLAAAAGSPGQLLLARLLAGACGGPAVAMGQAVVADVVPGNRRGRSMALVLGANAVASVLGVPAGLVLAERSAWWGPFALLGCSALVGSLLVQRLLPETAPRRTGERPSWSAILRQPGLQPTLLMVGLGACSTFLLAPNLSAFVQHNLGLPRGELAGLYALGGCGALGAMLLAGRLADRLGTLPVLLAATTLFCATLGAFVGVQPPLLPIALGFVTLMGSIAARNVPLRTLGTRVPTASLRAGSLSLLSAAQYSATALGALLGAALLTETEAGALVGLDRVALLAGLLALLTLPLVARVERGLRVPGAGA